MDFPPLTSDPGNNVKANESPNKNRKKSRNRPNRHPRNQSQQSLEQHSPMQKLAPHQSHLSQKQVLQNLSGSPEFQASSHQSTLDHSNRNVLSNVSQNFPCDINLDLECITSGLPLHECHLCSKQFPPGEVKLHIASQSHSENKTSFKKSLYFLQLPNPPQASIAKLEEFLLDKSKKSRISKTLEESVDRFINLVNEAIAVEVNPKASVRLFGSWLSGLAIARTSNINLDLLYDQKGVRMRLTSTSEDDKLAEESFEENSGEDNPAQILSKVAAIIPEISFPPELGLSVSGVKYEYEKSIPSVNITLETKSSSKPNQVQVEILLCGQRAYETSMLIKKYAELDERFLVLARCLRMWVATCTFDDQEAGTWPPHAFTIMLIHFLQKRSPPVLPYLQKAGKETNESLRDKLYDQENQELENVPDKSLEGIMNFEWKSENTESIGQLWLEFFRYFAIQFKAGKEVLSIRQPNSSAPLTHKDKGWTSKIIAIEEPFRTWLNLSRSVGKREIYDVFMHVLRESFAYFTIPHQNGSPVYGMNNFTMIQVPPELNATLSNLSVSNNHQHDSQVTESDDESPDEDEEDEASDTEKERYKDSSARYREAKLLASKFGIRLAPDEKVTNAETYDYTKSTYTFSFGTMPWFKNPSKFCHLCRKSGHSGKGCPKANLPKLEILPDEIDRTKFTFYSQVLESIYDRNKITTDITQRHERIANELQELIRQYHPTAIITLFGSSVNGFGSDNCDVDLCMTFEGNESGEDISPKPIIEQLASILRKYPNVVTKSVLPIVHAKVPICKFQYVGVASKPIECDISLYNILALSNTGMLRAYTLIDPRVAMLGTIVKHFAKVCDIGDASRGSLSSYAYTLMTLHYLQQVKVIPCLQELHDGKKPINRVDRWNTWFFDDLSRLDQVWPHRGENNQTIAELFLGFLRYYAEYFKFEENVVCCRKLEKLSRLEKMWTGKKISIEDPFLLKHNLGQGLDNGMATYIKSSIILGRNHFGKAIVNEEFTNLSQAEATARLFDKKKITVGPLPSGRGCRICHKVAHKIRDCPQLKLRRQIRPQIICNNCRKPGHEARNCSEPRMMRSNNNMHRMHHQQQQQQQQQHHQSRRNPNSLRQLWRPGPVYHNKNTHQGGQFSPHDVGNARHRMQMPVPSMPMQMRLPVQSSQPNSSGSSFLGHQLQTNLSHKPL